MVALTDSAGALVERYTYDPYGRTLIEKWEPTTNHWQLTTASGLGNPWMGTCQRYDVRTGLYAFLYRSHSPGLGRWLQRDPLEYEDGVNLYEYVSGNPCAWYDSLGLRITIEDHDKNKCFTKQVLDALTKMCPCFKYNVSKDGTVHKTRYLKSDKAQQKCIREHNTGCGLVNEAMRTNGKMALFGKPLKGMGR